MLRRSAAIAGSALLLASLAGCSTAHATPAAAKFRTVAGSMQLDGGSFNDTDAAGTGNGIAAGDACDAGDGYADIASGAEVDVVDGSGKVLAVSQLGDGTVGDDLGSCVFPFSVEKVPAGQNLYGVKVGNSNRGIVHFPASQFWSGPQLTLGS